MPQSKTAPQLFTLSTIKFTARPDIIDFRDVMYQPSLKEVPIELPLETYRKHKLPILDQGEEGACTGFGLAAVVNYLLLTRKVYTDKTPVSPYMLYENARRYDEWRGENYEGSSARGAMKGWHKHGVCNSSNWKDRNGRLSLAVAKDALNRPLGVYYRIKTNDLVSIHNALAEVGILYATANVHTGWERVLSAGEKAGIIPFSLKEEEAGGHAFAIVGYTKDGLWIQNSWGSKWGFAGYALIAYDDWLKNANDVWVARLGVPIQLDADNAVSKIQASRQMQITTSFLLRPHVISIGNDGMLKHSGRFGTDERDLQKRFEPGSTFETITHNWKKKRIVIYAHGGLVDEDSALETLSQNREAMIHSNCYPVMFIWHSDALSTIGNIVKQAIYGKEQDESRIKSFNWLSDRWDESIEVLARPIGRKMWNEMKENAIMATRLVSDNSFNAKGGAKLFLDELVKLMDQDESVEVHFVAHSAGSIFIAGMIDYLHAKKKEIESCTLWAPACTMDVFNKSYAPALKEKTIKRSALFTLSDSLERDDTASPLYRKSLLYLVSNSFEEKASPFNDEDEKILGMEKFSASYAGFFATENRHIRVVADREVNESKFKLTSNAKRHGDFDNDPATRKSTLRFILGNEPNTEKSNVIKSNPIVGKINETKPREQKRKK